MKKFETSLLREKFVIQNASAGATDPVIALSNRIVANLIGDDGVMDETLVVRAHNMHSCARFAARIVQSYSLDGSLITRAQPYDWKATWDTVINDYERSYNQDRWAVIYHQGRIVFSTGSHHAFFDVIEKCQANNRGEYDRAIPMAEETFRTMGKHVRINYDGNYALTINLEERQARIGVIVRSPIKSATFNFSVTGKNKSSIIFSQCILAAAAFLEGIQLAFMVGTNEEKIRIEKIKRHSKEDLQTTDARKRINHLHSEILALENTFEVRYRPERPDFAHMLNDAEKLARGNVR